MEYKPEKHDLIAYLYGELNQEGKQKIERYFQDHPEEKSQLEELNEVRDIMGKLPEREVIEPNIYLSNPKQSWFDNRWLRTSIGIAASLLILITASYFLQLRLTYSNQSITLSFGDAVPVQEYLTRNQVEELVNNRIENYDQLASEKRNRDQDELNTRFASLQQDYRQQFEEQVHKISNDQDKQLRRLVDQLQRQNLSTLAELIDQSSRDQQIYVQTALADFSDAIQNQRYEDLVTIEQNLSRLKQNSDLYYEETGQILASLITHVNTQGK